ncbi:AraC family transcriptional regulator [Bombilactobacillus bombi]|uniref:AraC family transcriptional regulator n=1 Tax=Bombilactobacillus bombi TaxID=1303590 RepID=UPI0015E61E9D|nr:helix-turn-helix transcriptional regulator [Bombilactobacillus bombi]MBA1433696.1 AraC family transcriptional regulator [Bombilactobacillus bombi]
MRIVTRLNTTLPLSGETVGYHWTQTPVRRSHGYPFYHWLQTEAGVGKIIIGQQHFLLKAHEGVLLAPFVAHQYYPWANQTWQTAFLTFSGALAAPIVNYLFPQPFARFHLDASTTGYLQEHYDCFQQDDAAATILQSQIIYNFLLLLQQRVPQTPLTFSQKAIVQPLVAYIHRHYSQKITNQQLQAVTQFSVSHTNKVFKNYFNMTPLQYLTDYRLRQAKALMLSKPELQIQEIAAATGFEDVSHFIKLFREHNHLTPRQFQRGQS